MKCKIKCFKNRNHSLGRKTIYQYEVAQVIQIHGLKNTVPVSPI